MIAGPFAVFNTASTGARAVQDWEIFEDKLYTDHLIIYIDYRFRVAESKMPEWFVELLVLAVAAAIAKPVTDETSTAQMMHEAAYGVPSDNGRGGMFAVASFTNSQLNPPPQIEDFTLIDARFS